MSKRLKENDGQLKDFEVRNMSLGGGECCIEMVARFLWNRWKYL